MQVRQGWSGETAPNRWGKVDVTVDEGDLRRILTAAGLGDVDPVDVPVTVAFQLLDAESEWLLLAKLITRFGHGDDASRARMAELAASRSKTLDKLRVALGRRDPD